MNIMLSTRQVNALDCKQFLGAPRLSILENQGWQDRSSVLFRSLYAEEGSPAPEPLKSDNDNPGTLTMVSSPAQTGPAGFKRQRPPPREANDIVDLYSDVWRQRREEAQGMLETTGTAPKAAETTKWKIAKVLVGHRGWVYAVAVDPTNSWFATGSFDSVIKVWDVASGALKLNLVGHKEAVRSIAISKTSPYMFSGSDDHAIKCWDLERNEVVREFFGHRSAVHSIAVHPVLDVVVSGGRDTTVRVWDIRTRQAVHTLTGHQQSVMTVMTQTMDPQVISGGNDGFIYLWDLKAGKSMARLTRHKKPVRGLALTPSGSHLVSCGADEIRVWKMPSGEFECNASTTVPSFKGSKSTKGEELSYLWSSCAMSGRGTLAVGSQDGHLAFYDWNQQPEHIPPGSFRKVVPYYRTVTKSIPGTAEREGGINSLTYDASGTRLITVESDKSIKLWQSKQKPQKA